MHKLTVKQAATLQFIDFQKPKDRDDLYVDYQETFDELIKLGYIKPHSYYYLTHAGEGKLQDYWDEDNYGQSRG